jgi:Family of unknown function (DUF5989)
MRLDTGCHGRITIGLRPPSGRKKFWVTPIVAVLSVLSGLIVWTQGSAIAPFIYSLW